MINVPLKTVLLSLESGARPKGGVSADSGDIPSIGGEHLTDIGNFDFTNIKRIPVSFFKKMKTGHISSLDILIVKDGATTGKTSFVRTNFPFKEAAVNEHVFCVRVNPEKALPAYIYHFLRSVEGQKAILQDFRGATVGGISREFAAKVVLPLPSLPEQQRIADILDRAEALRAKRRVTFNHLDELIKSVFIEMFGDPVENPKEWKKKALKEFGEIITGNTPSRKNPEYYGDYIEWIKSDNINTPYMCLTRSEEMLSEKGSKVGRTAPINSVLVTCIAGSLSCIGNVAIADRSIAFNQQINAIVPNENVNTLFLYHLILNTKGYIQSHSTQSMKGMISKGVFGSVPFIMPPIEDQVKFAEFAKKVEKIRKSQHQSLLELNNLFNSLFHEAFSGKLFSHQIFEQKIENGVKI